MLARQLFSVLLKADVRRPLLFVLRKLDARRVFSVGLLRERALPIVLAGVNATGGSGGIGMSLWIRVLGGALLMEREKDVRRATRRHFLEWSFCVLSLLLPCSTTRAEATGGMSGLADLVASVRANQSRLARMRIDAEWEEYEKGRLVGRSKESIVSDEFGRIRVRVTQIGPLRKPTSEGEVFPRRSDACLDGEKVIEGSFFASPAPAEPQRANQRGAAENSSVPEWSYTIRDNSASSQSHVRGHRNPVTFLSAFFLRLAERAALCPPSVTALGKDRVVVAFRCAGEPIAWECTLAATDGARVERIVAKDANGMDAMTQSVQWKKNANGAWLPDSGAYSTRQGATEWRFRVEDCRPDDSTINDTDFQMELSPNALVNDTRYGVMYRVGQDRVMDDQLAGLAAEALNARKQRAERPVVTRGGVQGLYIGLAVAGGAIATVILGVRWFRNR